MKNKVKLQISTLVVLMVLLAPSLTYAAWWKPSTWFKKPLPAVTLKVVRIATSTETERIKSLEKQIVDLKGQVNKKAKSSSSVPKSPVLDDSYLKVERCKAELDSKMLTVEEELKSKTFVGQEAEKIFGVNPTVEIVQLLRSNSSSKSVTESLPVYSGMLEDTRGMLRKRFYRDFQQDYLNCINR